MTHLLNKHLTNFASKSKVRQANIPPKKINFATIKKWNKAIYCFTFSLNDFLPPLYSCHIIRVHTNIQFNNIIIIVFIIFYSLSFSPVSHNPINSELFLYSFNRIYDSLDDEVFHSIEYNRPFFSQKQHHYISTSLCSSLLSCRHVYTIIEGFLFPL